MSPEYYALIRSYVTQDSAVLFSFGLALALLTGWWLVRKFKMPWLENFYIGQIMIVYAFLLYVLGQYPLQ
jgi:hypothetical protein